MGRVRHRLAAVNVDPGQLVYPTLEDVPVIVYLHELSPVGGRATSGRDGRRFEWFAEVCQDLPDRPRFGHGRAATTGALEPFRSERKWERGRDTVPTVELCLGAARDTFLTVEMCPCNAAGQTCTD